MTCSMVSLGGATTPIRQVSILSWRRNSSNYALTAPTAKPRVTQTLLARHVGLAEECVAIGLMKLSFNSLSSIVSVLLSLLSL